jgi:hypothetical protein
MDLNRTWQKLSTATDSLGAGTRPSPRVAGKFPRIFAFLGVGSDDGDGWFHDSTTAQPLDPTASPIRSNLFLGTSYKSSFPRKGPLLPLLLSPESYTFRPRAQWFQQSASPLRQPPELVACCAPFSTHILLPVPATRTPTITTIIPGLPI